MAAFKSYSGQSIQIVFYVYLAKSIKVRKSKVSLALDCTAITTYKVSKSIFSLKTDPSSEMNNNTQRKCYWESKLVNTQLLTSATIFTSNELFHGNEDSINHDS
jgi:hypothetical protein